MSDYTRHAAPTQYVEVAGVRLAYRRFGKKAGLPLVFIPHILGTMRDGWIRARPGGHLNCLPVRVRKELG